MQRTHAYVLKRMGLSDEQARDVQLLSAEPSADEAVLALAAEIVETRGQVPDGGLQPARAAGVSDAQVVAIAAWVGINTFSNYVNNIVRPPSTSPMSSSSGAPSAAPELPNQPIDHHPKGTPT